jgi:hypothetical protein
MALTTVGDELPSPTRPQRIRSSIAPFTKVLALLGLAGCADTEFDRIYTGSLHYWRHVSREDLRSERWEIEKERWLRGELGPATPEPPKPRYLYPSDMDVLRMRYMERELIAFLSAQCPDGTIVCTIRELQRLGFTCADQAPTTCRLINTAYGDIYSPFSRIRERHAWTVTVASGQTAPRIVARVEQTDPSP